MVVIDTNILAYLLISGDRTRDARALFERDPDWQSEAFLLVEFSNLLATYERKRQLTRSRSEELLHDAEVRIDSGVHVPHLTALRLARRFGVSAYDARFLAAANARDTQLVTEDARLRAAAPGLTRSLSDALREHR